MLKPSKHWQKLRAWWETPLGQSFLSAEQSQAEKLLPTLFGYHLLLLGEPQFVSCLQKSPILHRVWLHQMPSFQEGLSAIGGRTDKLPIIQDGIDVIYLAHCLEFVDNPHEVLREGFRVLLPEGHIIISNFNPWSIWGIWRFLIRYIKPAAWDGHFISITRLKDWLSLLGFDVLSVSHYYFRPPIQHIKTLERLKFLETIGRWIWPFWSGGYIIHAQKRIITLTAIRPILAKQPKFEEVPDLEPVRSE